MYKPEAKYDNLTGQFKINSMKTNPKNGNSYYLGKKSNKYRSSENQSNSNEKSIKLVLLYHKLDNLLPIEDHLTMLQAE